MFVRVFSIVLALWPLVLAGMVLCGLLWQGAWIWAALALLSFGIFASNRPSSIGAKKSLAGFVLITTSLLHFPIFFLAVLRIGEPQGLGAGILALIAVGLFAGQVSNAGAHELIHARARGRFWLGVAIFCSHLFGHHASAHRLVHHVHVATAKDPNSAPRGMGLYRFLHRAWAGSFRDGMAAEAARAQRMGMPAIYWQYGALSLALLGISFALAGPSGVFAHILLAGYATMQLLTVDYVQHYGLRRVVDAAGKPEAFGPSHSWDAPGIFSAAMGFNASRHGEHHQRPATPFEALAPGAPSMMLPYSLPVMGFIAFFPRWWRRVMAGPLARVATKVP